MASEEFVKTSEPKGSKSCDGATTGTKKTDL